MVLHAERAVVCGDDRQLRSAEAAPESRCGCARRAATRSGVEQTHSRHRTPGRAEFHEREPQVLRARIGEDVAPRVACRGDRPSAVAADMCTT